MPSQTVIVVAAYNEADRIGATLAALAAAFPGARVWVADDQQRSGKGAGERRERRADPLGLVVGGDDCEDVRGHGLSGAVAIPGRRTTGHGDALSEPEAIVPAVSDDRRFSTFLEVTCPR